MAHFTITQRYCLSVLAAISVSKQPFSLRLSFIKQHKLTRHITLQALTSFSKKLQEKHDTMQLDLRFPLQRSWMESTDLKMEEALQQNVGRVLPDYSTSTYHYTWTRKLSSRSSSSSSFLVVTPPTELSLASKPSRNGGPMLICCLFIQLNQNNKHLKLQLLPHSKHAASPLQT